MKRRILIGIDVDGFKHPSGHPGFTLDKIKENWTDSTVRAIVRSLKEKQPVQHNGKALRAYVLSNQLVED